MNFLFHSLFAAFLEILGCFGVWEVVRHHRSPWWLLPSFVSLLTFAYLLTRIDATLAGRAFAAYGGIYICASLLWLWQVERTTPTRFDLAGAVLCLAGASLIIYAPRAS